MAKKKQSTQPRQMTRRQLSHHARTKRRQRLTLYGGIAVVVIVIGLVVLGVLSGYVFPMKATVLQINDRSFDLHYFIDALDQAATNQPNQSVQSLSSQIIKQIENIELINQGAAKLGITIPTANITAGLQAAGLPDRPFYRDIIRYDLLKKQLQGVYFTDQQQNPAPQVNIQGMLVEDATMADQIRSQFMAADNITDLVKEYGVNYYSKNAPYGDFGWHPEPILENYFGSKVPLEWAFKAPAGAVSEPLTDNATSKQVGYWLLKVNSMTVIPTTDNTTGPVSANVTGILLGSLHEAQEVLARIKAGGDVATISANLSQFSASQKNGGQLGILNQPSDNTTPAISPAVDAVIFNPKTPTGVWLDPVKDTQFYTKGGAWLIKVIDTSPSRQLSADDLNTLVTDAYNSWFNGLSSDKSYKITNTLTAEQQALAVKQAEKNLHRTS